MGLRTAKVNSAKVRIPVTKENLVPLCYANGFKGVPPLAKKIGRHEKTIWKAIRWPDQFGPTYQKIQEALCA
jgi:hypothetical protein